MNNLTWKDNHIVIDPPKRPKKITGTRFASILNLNVWSTPFEAWCDICRVYTEPFEDTKYTIAGKIIEPKQAEYLKKAFFMTNLVTPEEIYGKDPDKKMNYDFFPDEKIFGGMWDSLLINPESIPESIIEFKTTSRPQDWQHDTPEYYALQGAFYAYNKSVNNVVMVCSFLEDGDYDSPEDFEPTTENTIVRPFAISERYENFEKHYIKTALKWWNDHVITGISPPFDEKKDAKILKHLRSTVYSPDNDLTALIVEAEELKTEIVNVTTTISDKEKRLKQINDIIKQTAIDQFKDGDETVIIEGKKYLWNLSKSVSDKFDEKRFSEENKTLFNQYLIPTESYRLTMKEIN